MLESTRAFTQDSERPKKLMSRSSSFKSAAAPDSSLTSGHAIKTLECGDKTTKPSNTSLRSATDIVFSLRKDRVCDRLAGGRQKRGDDEAIARSSGSTRSSGHSGRFRFHAS